MINERSITCEKEISSAITKDWNLLDRLEISHVECVVVGIDQDLEISVIMGGNS